MLGIHKYLVKWSSFILQSLMTELVLTHRVNDFFVKSTLILFSFVTKQVHVDEKYKDNNEKKM